MANYTVRPLWQIDADVVRRLSRRWAGKAISLPEVVQTATLIGRLGRVLVGGGSKENVLGFYACRVESPREILVRWLVADPENRQPVLRLLLNSLRREFPGFDYVIRVPNNAAKYEFLADLRDATGSDVTPDSSRAVKVTDEYASHVYVRVGPDKQLPASRRHHGPTQVEWDPGEDA